MASQKSSEQSAKDLVVEAEILSETPDPVSVPSRPTLVIKAKPQKRSRAIASAAEPCPLCGKPGIVKIKIGPGYVPVCEAHGKLGAAVLWAFKQFMR